MNNYAITLVLSLDLKLALERRKYIVEVLLEIAMDFDLDMKLELN